jgi:hypothetical protein
MDKGTDAFLRTNPNQPFVWFRDGAAFGLPTAAGYDQEGFIAQATG